MSPSKKPIMVGLVYLLAVIVFVLVIVVNQYQEGNEVVPESIPVQTPYELKIQDKIAMDWDYKQEYYLIYKAMEQSGYVADAETYAFNIVVTLNRVVSPCYPNTIEELYDSNVVYLDLPDEVIELS